MAILKDFSENQAAVKSSLDKLDHGNFEEGETDNEEYCLVFTVRSLRENLAKRSNGRIKTGRQRKRKATLRWKAPIPCVLGWITQKESRSESHREEERSYFRGDRRVLRREKEVDEIFWFTFNSHPFPLQVLGYDSLEGLRMLISAFTCYTTVQQFLEAQE